MKYVNKKFIQKKIRNTRSKIEGKETFIKIQNLIYLNFCHLLNCVL